jgi:hypothetical protein
MIYAFIFLALSIFVIGFQLALAFGAPWGAYTLGGKYPGKLPKQMRIFTLVQIAILFVFNGIVWTKAGLSDKMESKAEIGIWVVVGFFVLGTLANFSSASKKERRLMGPLNIIALICALMLALEA